MKGNVEEYNRGESPGDRVGVSHCDRQCQTHKAVTSSTAAQVSAVQARTLQVVFGNNRASTGKPYRHSPQKQGKGGKRDTGIRN